MRILRFKDIKTAIQTDISNNNSSIYPVSHGMVHDAPNKIKNFLILMTF